MKKILYGVAVIFLLLIGVEAYLYRINNGNIVIYILNQSDKKNSIDVSLDINNHSIFSGLILSNTLKPQKIILNEGIGKQHLLLRRKDLNIKIDESFNVFLVKWIIIDMYSNHTTVDYSIIPPLFQ